MVQVSHPYMTTGKTITDYTDLCWRLKYVCYIISHLLYPLFVVLLLVQVLETQEFGLLYVILIIDSIVYENCLYYSIPKDIPDKREIVFNLEINL